MTQTHKNINYKYTNNNKEDLVVILPQAMQQYKDTAETIKLISQKFNCLFIESGYFGLSKIENKETASEHSMQEFSTKLHELIIKIPHKKLFLISGSVGGIHALNYLEKFPTEVTDVIITGPALYKNKGLKNLLLKALVKAGLATDTPSYFNFVTNLFVNNPKVSWLKSTRAKVNNTIGAYSYLKCLEEILDFTTKNPKRFDQYFNSKVNVLIGKQDSVFKLLCDEELCKRAKTIKWVDANHDTLNEARTEVINLLNKL